LLFTDIVVIFAFITGIHYQIENIITGIWNAEGVWTPKGKVYALLILIPYVQFYAMIWFSQYSQLFNDMPILFLTAGGLHLTWVNAIFNLSSTASKLFEW